MFEAAPLAEEKWCWWTSLGWPGRVEGKAESTANVLNCFPPNRRKGMIDLMQSKGIIHIVPGLLIWSSFQARISWSSQNQRSLKGSNSRKHRWLSMCSRSMFLSLVRIKHQTADSGKGYYIVSAYGCVVVCWIWFTQLYSYHKNRSRDSKCLLIQVCTAEQDKNVERVKFLKFQQRIRDRLELLQRAGKV